jgi:hypothetical protein
MTAILPPKFECNLLIFETVKMFKLFPFSSCTKKIILPIVLYLYLHITHAFVPEGVVETSQIFDQLTFRQNDLVTRNTAYETNTVDNPIAFCSQYITGVNPLVAFYDIHGRKERN